MIYMPIHIALFTNINIKQLENEVNSFLVQKQVLDVKFSDRADADGLAVMVIYEA